METIRISSITNPLQYAWNMHENYIKKLAGDIKILFVGMNPSSDSKSGVSILGLIHSAFFYELHFL